MLNPGRLFGRIPIMKKLLSLLICGCISILPLSANYFSCENEDGKILCYEQISDSTCILIPPLDNVGFYDYSGDINIPNTVEFYGYELAVTEIANHVISWHVKKIKIPANISIIRENAFYGADSLQAIDVSPNNIHFATYEGGLYTKDFKQLIAFPNLYSEKLIIPAQTDSIKPDAIARSWNSLLEHITVDQDNQRYASVDGILYDKNKKILMLCPVNKKGFYEIPESVTTISHKAFSQSHLTGISMSDNVVKLEENAFESYSGSSIFLSNNIETIPNRCFVYNRNLQGINLPTKLKKICRNAFSYCDALSNITFPEGLETIENYAFDGYSILKSIILPSSITGIGDYAFNGEWDILSDVYCFAERTPEISENTFKESVRIHVPFSALAEYQSDPLWSKFHIDSDMDVEKAKYGEFTISADAGNFHFTQNGLDICVFSPDAGYCYYSNHSYNNIPFNVLNKDSLKVFSISEGVEYKLQDTYYNSFILEDAGCLSTTLSYNKAATITFEHATDSTWFIIINGSYLLPNREGEEVLIDNLKDHNGILYTIINDSITIGGYNGNEIDINIPGTIESKIVNRIGIKAFQKSILRSVVMSNTITDVGADAFSQSEISNVTLSTNLKELRSGVFWNCQNLKSIELHEGLLSIENGAFNYSGLEVLNIPSTVIYLYGPFTEMDYLKEINVSKDNSNYASIDGVLYSKYNGIIHTLTYVPNNSHITTLKVPKNVTAIMGLGKKLKQLYLNPNINYIAQYWPNGFDTAPNLEDVFFYTPDANYITQDISTNIKFNCHVPIGYKDNYNNNSHLNGCTIIEDVVVEAESIIINKKDITAYPDNRIYLEASLLPLATTYKDIIWMSSNEEVVKVDSLGVAQTINPGNAYIYAICVSNKSITDSCYVTVNPVLITNIETDKEKEIYIGDTISIIPTITPSNATYQSLIWQSSDSLIAVVDSIGNVVGLKDGIATIRCTTLDGTNLSAECELTVLPILANSILLDKNALTIWALQCDTLHANVLPANTTYPDIEWFSSNDSIATVENGVITAIVGGEVIISARTTDGSDLQVSCNVTVINPVFDVIYMVDSIEYARMEGEYSKPVIPIEAPTKEGYIFSGWYGIPGIMPADSVVIYGNFSINTYMLTYYVDGEVYKTDSIEYGAAIVPEAEPTQEGYTFSGWSEIPETMPAHDVVVNGSFTINMYNVSIEHNEGGTVVVSATEVEHGGSVTITVIPDEGYEIYSVIINGNDATDMPWDSMSIAISDIRYDVSIVVTFAEMTGIEGIIAKTENDSVYDLRGRKVQNPRKGEIYIMNGRKFVQM